MIIDSSGLNFSVTFFFYKMVDSKSMGKMPDRDSSKCRYSEVIQMIQVL